MIAITAPPVMRSSSSGVSGKTARRAGRRRMSASMDFNALTVTGNRISVRFEYEWQDADSGAWFRTHGNEHWQFGPDGLMRRRDMSANDIPIDQSERRIGV